MSEPEFFRLCTTCKKPIGFAVDYLQCSVSTCNRHKLAQYFCSLPCWDAHLPEARHRDAWAEPVKAPTREAFQKEQQEEQGRDARSAEREAKNADREARGGARESTMSDDAEKRRRVVGAAAAQEALPQDVLVVVSKLKAYVKARSGMNTSDAVVDVLSAKIRRLCDAAIDVAQADGRKTILDRDFR